MIDRSRNQELFLSSRATYRYSIYGLRLDSTRPIPSLLPAQPGEPPDVVVSLEGIPDRFAIPAALLAHPSYASAQSNAVDEPNLKLWRLDKGDFVRFRYRDDTQFVVDRTGSKIWAQWPATMTFDDTLIYLLGPILGFVLRLRGVLCLHASVVAVHEQAFALLGPVGAGKSTTAAALAQLGCGILTEDLAPLVPAAEGFLALPGYSRIRLWPESADILFGSKEALPKLAPPWEKCYLDLDAPGYRFEMEPLPLRAVYLLGERTEGAEAPFIQDILPRQALVKLVANTYMNQPLTPEQRSQEFEMLGRMIGALGFRRVTAHTDPCRLENLCSLLLDDFRRSLNTRA